MKCQIETTQPVPIIEKIDKISDQGFDENTSSTSSSFNTSDLVDNFDSLNDSAISDPDRIEKQPTTARNRLISMESGFESFGKSKVSGSDLSGIINNNNEADDIISVLKSEENRQYCDNSDKTKEKVKKNRTTTINNVQDSYLDPKLINKSDGLQDVLCYIDENGSPQIREKYKKKTSKQPQKRLTYGTEECIDAFALEEKTPSCVSFSKICRRLKNSFCKFFFALLFSLELLVVILIFSSNYCLSLFILLDSLLFSSYKCDCTMSITLTFGKCTAHVQYIQHASKNKENQPHFDYDVVPVH